MITQTYGEERWSQGGGVKGFLDDDFFNLTTTVMSEGLMDVQTDHEPFGVFLAQVFVFILISRKVQNVGDSCDLRRPMIPHPEKPFLDAGRVEEYAVGIHVKAFDDLVVREDRGFKETGVLNNNM
jgi:hypothetical protein